MDLYRLPLVNLTFHLRAASRIYFGSPPVGSPLNGALRWAMRELRLTDSAGESYPACKHPDLGHHDCPRCPAFTECAYASQFEHAAALQVKGKLATIPRPFSLRLPDPARESYEPGEAWSFGLVLVGTAAMRWVHWMETVRQLGQGHGLGEGRGRFDLETVTADLGQSEVVLSPETQTVEPNYPVRSLWSNPGRPRRLEVRFVTPLSLKVNQCLYRRAPSFPMLLGCFVRDLKQLLSFHAPDLRWPWELDELLRDADAVRIREEDVRWEPGSRPSGPEKRSMDMGGLVGTAVYEGDLGPFVPALRLAEILHIGKRRTYGNGRIQLHQSGPQA